MYAQGFEDVHISPEVLRLAVQPSTTCWAFTGLMLANVLAVTVRKLGLLDMSKSWANTLSKCPGYCRVLAHVGQTRLDGMTFTCRG